MTRYINAVELGEKFHKYFSHISQIEKRQSIKRRLTAIEADCNGLLDGMPTVREVVHGQWHGQWIRFGTALECSACHNKIPAPMTKMYPYCPNCGADMRGDE